MRTISSTFKSGEPALPDLLKDIHSAQIQLPDFQRSWIWDDDRIRSLIASVSLSYPIGAVMLLQTGGDGSQFQPRRVEGVAPNGDTRPDHLILDGQQRMTSFYLALHSGKPVTTRTSRGERIERVYYLDIAKCLDPNADRLDAVLSLPTDRKITSDFGRRVELDASTTEKEYEQGLFPLEVVFDHGRYASWRRGYQRKHRFDEAKLDQFDVFEAEVVDRLRSYRVPIIELLRDTPKEAVCEVFEKVNTGGVTLTVFELMTATFAADNFNLRNDWDERQGRLHEYEVLQGVDATAFLMAVTLLSTYYHHLESSTGPVSCKRRDVLRLSLDEYRRHADRIEDGFRLAARFLAREKIFDAKTLPYTTQLIPLSAICAALGDRFEQDSVRRKLDQWYWCGVFGELYGGANETRFAFDLPEVISWVGDGAPPRTIRDATFSPTRLLSMQSRLSAAYKGLMALLMKAGGCDWLSGDSIEIASYFDLAIDIHHIFPRTYCEKSGYSRHLWNSSVNKTPLSSRTNRLLGGKAPSTYLTSLEKSYGHTADRLDEILRTHQLEPGLLRSDAFDEFIWVRATRLLNLIEDAMGKTVSGRDSDEVISAFGAPLSSTG